MTVQKESSKLTPRILLVAFCLAAGLTYRIIVGVFSPSIVQLGVLIGLAVIFLLITIFARKRPNLTQYWQIPFAFFIFTVAGILGDSSSYASVQQAFVANILHETTSSNNPIATTVLGTVLGQLVGTIGLVVPILLMTRATGASWSLIYLNMTKKWKWVLVGIAGFMAFFLLAAFGLSASFFPNNGVTLSQFLTFTPSLVVLVFLNGLREELWFRGLFLKKYGRFLGSISVNLLQAIIFTSFHVAVGYSRSLVFFLAIALVQGLVLGYLMQKSESAIPGIIFHAGIDIPIFLVYLSYT